MNATGTALLQRVFPADLVAKAVGPARHFLTAFGEAPLLCVELRDTSGGELQAGLTAAVDPQAHQANRALAFHTEMAPAPVKGAGSSTHGFSASALSQRLLSGHYFVLPLAKRAQETLSQQRISVGRARNTDVPLRDGSVSKFHAWFEIDDGGVVRVADAGSKNGTRLGGEPLPPRELSKVEYGQPVVFGSVNTFLCEATVFWEAFHLQG